MSKIAVALIKDFKTELETAIASLGLSPVPTVTRAYAPRFSRNKITGTKVFVYLLDIERRLFRER